jgi:interleukin-1 receptor-associated kinase 4
VDQEEAMMIKQFQTELETLSKYRHENIVPFLGFSVDGREKCLVYQYMPNGSLEDRLCCLNKTEPLSWELRVKISQGTAEGIVYLNNNKLVHRDIKSANVLLDEDFSPKVGDFATVRVAPSGSGISSAVSTKLVIGTSAYMAPEAPRFDISAKLDSFAFGVVLLELLTGLPPLDSDRSESDLLSYIQENCDDDISDYLDEKAGDWDIKVANTLYHMSQKCVETRKKDRVLVSDILPELDILVETKLS